MMAGLARVPPQAIDGQARGPVFAEVKAVEGRSVDEMEGEGLRRAGRSVTGCIWEDCRLADPVETVSKPEEGGAIAELSPAMQSINEGLVRLARLIVIPEMLLSQYTDKSKCFMGLMAEIGRAWMTVDERLYLWDFREARDVSVWAGDESAGPIIDVQLVRPRKGVFVEAIRWLLVVVTRVEIHLLGVQLEQGDLVLHDTRLVFGTDRVNMLATVGTGDGRIFCGGQDGQVYELEYEAEEGWFTRRCRKVNRTGSVLSRLAPTFLRASTAGRSASAIVSLKHDASRHVLWSMTEGGQVDAFSLDGAGWAHQATLQFSPGDVQRLHPTLLRTSIGERLVGIYPIGREESATLVLLAVTGSGLRLYYRTGLPAQLTDVRLAGVKAPQPISDLRGSGKAAKFNLTFLAASMASVHSGYQRAGLFAAAGALSDEEDILTIRSAKSAGGESSSEWRLEGKVWDVTEVHDDACEPLPLVPGGERMSNWWADLVLGHCALPRQVLCLTNAGIYVFEKERPVDTLSRLLSAASGNVEAEPVQAFFQRYLPADQAVAVSLVLATRAAGGDVSFWAANAAFKYGGEPGASASGEFQPSALHMGLFRFVGRLVAALWKRPVSAPLDNLDALIGHLRTVSRFLAVNAAFVFRGPAQPVPPRIQEAYQHESASLRHLERLVQRTGELLLFLAVCQDYRLPLAALVEPGVDLELLASSPVRGPALIKELGAALVRQQLHLQASVESLCAVLRNRSPTFFSPADVLVYEGTDAMERALKHPSREIRAQLLRESLDCFLKAPLSIEMASSVLERYRAARFYSGILALGQSSASLYERALACLEDLLAGRDGDDEAASIFSAALSSKSKPFLAAFYDWLFQRAIAGAVLLSARAFSADVLAYLAGGAFEGEALRSKAHADILWKYLAKHVRPAESGRVLLRLARALTHDASLEHVTLPVEERIQCLSMAVATLRASGAEVAAAEAAEAEDMLEVALVQLELLNGLRQRPGAPYDAQLQLHSRLFDLTTLFVEFSEPLGLPEVSLQIVHAAGHADPVLVARLWQRFLSVSAEPRLDDIQRSLAGLAAKLYPSDVAFPLPYLVDMLALLACKSVRAPEDESRMASWFTATWAQSGVPAEKVADALSGLLKAGAAPDSFWAAADRKRFLRLLLV